MTSLFVPDGYVPLSDFVEKNATQATMHVEPEILSWIADRSGTVQVCVRKASGQLQYFTATSANSTTGVVTLSSTVFGDCVVVTSLLRQNPVIATHWVQTLNLGRGGQQIGGTDGIRTIGVDLVGGGLVTTGPDLVNADPSWGDSVAGPYTWASEDLALFSDASGFHDDAEAPGYERYIGETYTTAGPTELAAIWLSDWARDATGFPLAHRSHPDAFDSGAAEGKKVENGLPVFQIVHAHWIDVADHTATDGDEDSLGTFVLPPGWTFDGPPSQYPILFNAFYDLHGSTFYSVGRGMIETLSALYEHAGGPRRAVGLIWNGGGASATYATHGSAYDNAAQFIDDADSLLRADPERVVFTGGSRGGITALAMASNPDGHPYTARFVNAYVPFPRMGSAIATANASYSMGLSSLVGVTGWQDSWLDNWSLPGDPGTDGRELARLNLFGTTSISSINANLSIDSPPVIDDLDAEGTCVVLRTGTHDAHRPHAYVAEYVDRLRAKGIPVQFEVFYRAGHAVALDTLPGDLELMNKVFDVDYTLTTSVKHYQRDPSDPQSYEEFSPTYIPLTFEAPLVVGNGQSHTWSFVGEPGGRFQVRMAYLGTTWNDGNTWPSSDSFTTVYSGILSQTSGAIFGTATVVRTISGSTGYRGYEVYYSPDGDTSWETVLGPDEYSVPGATKPVLYLGIDDSAGTQVGTRTGGVSEDAQF